MVDMTRTYIDWPAEKAFLMAEGYRGCQQPSRKAPCPECGARMDFLSYDLLTGDLLVVSTLVYHLCPQCHYCEGE